MKVIITESAMDDLQKARAFYGHQKTGLDKYFYNNIFKDIDSLTKYYSIHPVFFGFYRMLSKKFPYSIYYKVEDVSIITIYRVLDMRQNPEKIKSELS